MKTLRSFMTLIYVSVTASLLAVPGSPRAAFAAEVTYGKQVALVDVAAYSLMIGGVAALDCCHNRTLLASMAGIALYAFGAPVVHHIQGNDKSAVMSLGLRLGLPVVGGWAAATSTELILGTNTDWAAVGYGVLGIGVGAITASVIDAVFLARMDGDSTANVAFVMTPLIAF